MTRPLKFRAWHSGYMIPVSKLIHTDDGKDWYWQSEVAFDDEKPKTLGGIGGLMQFTGLTDRHGKEIYEGDIVRIIADNYAGNNDGDVMSVDFEDGGFAPLCNYPDMVCEVLGNIHENPELLK